jgi:1-acyl-sn-glycerol-3-phosphate acyltransferase
VEPWKYQPASDTGLSEGERLRSLQRESGLVSMAARNLWWWWVKGVLRVMERVEVHGREHLPGAAPFVLVSNHASHLDTMVLATALPLRLRNGIMPLAAGDTFFETPALAAFAANMMNALPLWRKHCGRHALAQLRARLVQEPCAYILFPEGTRSRTGEMGPFKSGLGMLVAGVDVPVVPCHLAGTFAAMPPDVKWPRRTRIVLRIGAAQRFSHLSNDRAGWQVIAEQMEKAVRELGKESGGSGEA